MPADKSRTWHQLTATFDNFITLRGLMFGQCPASLMHAVVDKLIGLEQLTAQFITDSTNESQ